MPRDTRGESPGNGNALQGKEVEEEEEEDVHGKWCAALFLSRVIPATCNDDPGGGGDDMDEKDSRGRKKFLRLQK